MPRVGLPRPASRPRSVVFPEPERPVTRVSRPGRNAALRSSNTTRSMLRWRNRFSTPLNVATGSPPTVVAARGGRSRCCSPVPPAASRTSLRSDACAETCEPIPASRKSASGRRSQPPRPTTSRPGPLRSRSSPSRPSRIVSSRSAIAVASGSWLTTRAVAPRSRTSSAISS